MKQKEGERVASLLFHCCETVSFLHPCIYPCDLFCAYPDQNDTVLVFRGSVYWTVSARGSVSDPRSLRQRWPDLPPAIEAAAFSPLDSKWYFFKGAASPGSLMRLTLPFKAIL